MMSGKTSPAQIPQHYRSFYGGSSPKRSRTHDGSCMRPAFKSLKDNLLKFDRKLSEPIKSLDLKEPNQQDAGEEPKSLDRDSPLPLKNLGNTCYENSIIQCLFSLNKFMDNFERSIERMRQYIVRPKIKTFDVQNNVPEKQETKENDVRYRIADAFDNLYKSYTKKRNQIEAINNQNHHTSTDAHLWNVKFDGPTANLESDIAMSQSSATISGCKSIKDHHSTTRDCLDDNQASAVVDVTTAAASAKTTAANIVTSSTATTDTAAANLTPIALISSATTPNEQSEIETRLEDLKSAVGERSSQFNSTHQQDASEFFYHVIDSIQEFYQSLDKTDDDDNPVTKTFELELDYLIKCPKCHHQIMSEPEKIRTLPLALPHVNNDTSVNQEDYNHETNSAPTPPTSDLGLDSPESNSSEEHKNGSDEKENEALVDEIVPGISSSDTMSIARLELSDKSESQNSQKHYTLCDALNNYFKDDLLEYNCSQHGCDSKQRTKRCLIRKLPQVLFITLARYSYTGKKNLDEIEAPFELSVPFRENKSPSHSPQNYCESDVDNDKYQLVAVVCHLGSSLNAGHYTSYVYNQNNFTWYSCDDDSITKVQEADVKTDATKSGYCFFYSAKSCINQDQHQAQEQNLAQDLSRLERTEAIVADKSVAESSVVLTPESSPKSSPTPSAIAQGEAHMHDGHLCSAIMSQRDIDDWS